MGLLVIELESVTLSLHFHNRKSNLWTLKGWANSNIKITGKELGRSNIKITGRSSHAIPLVTQITGIELKVRGLTLDANGIYCFLQKGTFVPPKRTDLWEGRGSWPCNFQQP